MVLYVRPEQQQLIAGGIVHLAEVSGIDLGMAAEYAKILVEERGIEVEGQTFGQVWRESFAFGMEVVYMIFKSHMRCFYQVRII